MNALFVSNGCGVCQVWKEALRDLNSLFRLYGLKINIIYVEENDPKCYVLAKHFKSNNPGDWYIPVLVLDRPGGEEIHDIYKHGSDEVSGRTITQGLIDRQHCKSFLRKIVEMWYM